MAAQFTDGALSPTVARRVIIANKTTMSMAAIIPGTIWIAAADTEGNIDPELP